MTAERCQYQLNSNKQYLQPVLAFTDFVGSLLFSQKKREIEVKSILIIQMGNFGDLVVTLPTIEGFKQAFPGAKVDVLMKKSMLSAVPKRKDLFGVIATEHDWMPSNGKIIWKEFFSFMKSPTFKMLKGQYDLIVDVHGDPRNIWLAYRLGGKLRAGFGIRGLGFFLTHKAKFDTDAHIIDRYYETVKCFKDIPLPEVDVGFNNIKGRTLVCIHPGTGLKIKGWTEAGWAEVADTLVESGYSVIFTGTGNDEKDMFSKIKEKMQFGNLVRFNELQTFDVYAAIIQECALFISPDTGPAHIAHLIGTPQLTLFGPSMAKRWGYEGSYLEQPCECVNALECKYGFENRCMSKLEPERVIKEVMVRLNG